MGWKRNIVKALVPGQPVTAKMRPRGGLKSGWQTIGNRAPIYFRSGWEVNIARYFEFQVRKGLIANWEFEPRTFWFETIKRGVRSYLPDFLITRNDGTHYWVEVKGYMDSRSKTKIKRMAKYYPEEELQVIDQKRYNAIKSTASLVVPGWE